MWIRLCQLPRILLLFAGPSLIAQASIVRPRQDDSAASAPVVDLGYASYQGFVDSGVNVWKGVRYAEAPTGPLRWQAPREPQRIQDSVIQATEQPPLCPQTGASAETPAIYGFTSALGDEDCLFLNVYAPPNARKLPVFLWIHGGGYGVFGATADPIPLMNANDNGFVSVIIQYRLGAFGFLSSQEVSDNGVVNAGLLDQNFALQWVQKYIHLFGGDPKSVTVAGESAGAGAAMLQAMAYGGKQKEKLFQNVIAASPFSPPQYQYNAPIPTQNYESFAELAGCGGSGDGGSGYYSQSPGVFDCLVAADSETLQNASFRVSEAGQFGTWAFLPVTDGNFVQELPSDQLLNGRVNGKRILSGNNANEGVPLSPPTISTEEEVVDFLRTAFPRLTEDDISKILDLYSYEGDDEPVDPSDPLFDTLGNSGPTAINQSIFGTGQQQRLYNIFAETTFVCPSYWLAEAFSDRSKKSWKYQYSFTSAFHGADLQAYFSRDQTIPNEEFRTAFQKVWGSFIINGTPVITVEEATAGDPNAVVPEPERKNKKKCNGRKKLCLIDWPPYDPDSASPLMMDFNATGGSLDTTEVTPNLDITFRVQPPDISNSFRLVDAESWEGGRGGRCRFWADVIGDRVPQ